MVLISMILSSPLAVEVETVRSVMVHVMLYVPALIVAGVVTLTNDSFLNGTEFAAATLERKDRID